MDEYILPAGGSALLPYYIFKNEISQKIFDSDDDNTKPKPPPARIINAANSIWDGILTSCGAKIVEVVGNDDNRNGNNNNKSNNNLFDINFIVVDSHTYANNSSLIGGKGVGLIDEKIGNCIRRQQVRILLLAYYN
jgi:hypothetical protein